jgi:hypothetical protein
MSTDINQWLPYSTENAEALRRQVKEFRDGGPVKAIDILMDQTSFSNLRKWINNNISHQKISRDHYYKLVIVGLRDGWLRQNGFHLYAEIARSLGYPVPSDGIVHDGPSTDHYIVYRYSYIAPGYVLHGSLSVTHEKYQIKTKERYRIQADVAESAFGANDMVFNRSGFLFKIGSRFLLVSQRDDRPGEVKTAYLESITGRARAMKGPFSDRHGEYFYAARMYAKPRQNPLADSEIRATKPEGIVDETILEYLTSLPKSGKIVISL